MLLCSNVLVVIKLHPLQHVSMMFVLFLRACERLCVTKREKDFALNVTNFIFPRGLTSEEYADGDRVLGEVNLSALRRLRAERFVPFTSSIR